MKKLKFFSVFMAIFSIALFVGCFVSSGTALAATPFKLPLVNCDSTLSGSLSGILEAVNFHFAEDIGPGCTGAYVTELQKILSVRGLHPGKIDGIFGTDTASAVEALQSANNLVSDGIVGPRTRALINSVSYLAVYFPYDLGPGNTDSAEVTNLQRILSEDGMYTGKIDGIFGTNTVSAVKAFQTKNKLVADGIVGYKTRPMLNSPILPPAK